MTTYSITTTDQQDNALTSIVQAINDNRPLDMDGNLIGDSIDEATYFNNRIQDVLNSYVQQQVLVEAEAVKQNYLSSTPEERVNIASSISNLKASPPVINKM